VGQVWEFIGCILCFFFTRRCTHLWERGWSLLHSRHRALCLFTGLSPLCCSLRRAAAPAGRITPGCRATPAPARRWVAAPCPLLLLQPPATPRRAALPGVGWSLPDNQSDFWQTKAVVGGKWLADLPLGPVRSELRAAWPRLIFTSSKDQPLCGPEGPWLLRVLATRCLPNPPEGRSAQYATLSKAQSFGAGTVGSEWCRWPSTDLPNPGRGT